MTFWPTKSPLKKKRAAKRRGIRNPAYENHDRDNSPSPSVESIQSLLDSDLNPERQQDDDQVGVGIYR